jgi:hypothetical protein
MPLLDFDFVFSGYKETKDQLFVADGHPMGEETAFQGKILSTIGDSLRSTPKTFIIIY